jgi:predicted MFS family arabinose efflux permease
MLGSFLALALFAAWEARNPAPLLPLAIVLDRRRGGAALAVALSIAGMFGAFLFLTYYLQVVRGFSPVLAGIAFLPLSAAMQAGSWGIASRLMPRLSARWLMTPGALVAASGMLVLTQLQAGGGYWTRVFPAELLLGLGISCVMVPAFSRATLGVDRSQAGVAASIVNAASQLGGSLGTALLNSVAVGVTASYLALHHGGSAAPAGIVRGYTTASGVAALLLAAAGLIAFLTSGESPAQDQKGQALDAEAGGGSQRQAGGDPERGQGEGRHGAEGGEGEEAEKKSA